MYFNENKFIIYNGRRATGSGLIGFFLGIIISIINSFSLFGIIIFALFMGYLFLSGFWGAYKVIFWFRKYKYKMPKIVWYSMRLLIAIPGIILGIAGWGFFEHFILLLSLGTTYNNIGMVSAQLILLPYIGKYYAGYKNFSDGY